MAISINEIKSGLTIKLDGQVYSVLEYQHVKPGKGAAFVRTKLRNLKTGGILERTFKGDQMLEDAFVQERKLQYLYRANNLYYFMDQDSFEEVGISEDMLKDNTKFLKDNLLITGYSYEEEILNVALPTFIELEVINAEPGLKGDTAKAATKIATLQTNATVSVPLFIKIGDIIKIDTRSGQYVERLK